MSVASEESLGEHIGQLFMAGFHGTTPTPEISALIRDDHLGGVILFTRNIRNNAQLRELTQALQQIARDAGQRTPLLIATDQENGLVRRLGPDATLFPGNMALGATGSAELTEAVAAATGRELRAAGINMNLAPDADVNNNPVNPVIGVRSFGGDSREVAQLTAAAVRGYRAAGVVATLKHFPGHGDTAIDSHRALPVVPFDLDRLEATELPPFAAGIDAGAECVMLAHVLLPQIEPDTTLPASISPSVMRDLLRGRLGFSGVAMTDCLEMNAIAGTVGVVRGAVLALRAGVDLVLISHAFERQRAAIAAARAALDSGEIDPETVRQALVRMAQLRERLAWNAPAIDSDTLAAHRDLRDRAYALSTTLACNPDRIVPLHLMPEQPLLVVAQHSTAINQAVDIPYDHAAVAAAIRRRHANLDSYELRAGADESERQEVVHAAHRAGAIVAILINARFDPAQTALMRDLLAVAKPVIGIAAGEPYDLALFPTLAAGIATYEYTEPALEAAVRILFGECAAKGHMPAEI
jgi:beta-N-acetylhexosaminidase